MMSQAVKQYMADEGVDDLRNTALSSDNYDEYCESPEAIASIRNFVTKYLKVVEECDYDANNCFAPKYKGWDGSDEQSSGFVDYVDDSRRDYVLADGSIIRIGYYASGCPIDLFVDINGKKGPNRVGYDLWYMSIFYDGVIDESGVLPEVRRGEAPGWGTPQGIRQWRFENDCQRGTYGGCFGHFLENNFKFDY